MTDYQKEAEEIYDRYTNRTRNVSSIPFQDAVLAFMFLIIRLLIEKKTTNKK
jgi:hypothetical protein